MTYLKQVGLVNTTAHRFYDLEVIEDNGVYEFRLTYGWLANRGHSERNHEIVQYQGSDAAKALKHCNQAAAIKLRNGYIPG